MSTFTQAAMCLYQVIVRKLQEMQVLRLADAFRAKRTSKAARIKRERLDKVRIKEKMKRKKAEKTQFSNANASEQLTLSPGCVVQAVEAKTSSEISEKAAKQKVELAERILLLKSIQLLIGTPDAIGYKAETKAK